MNKQMLTLPKISLLLFLCLGFFACDEDEFLTRVPDGRFTPSNFYETPRHIEEANNALYRQMRGLNIGRLYQYGEYRSDNTTFEFDLNDRGRTGIEEIDYFLMNTDNGFLGGFYNDLYNSIARTNYIIAQVGDVPFEDADLKLAREAEARFFRGYLYFLAVQHYGNIPLVLEPLQDGGESLIRLRQSGPDEIYQQVVLPDLQFAIDNLPVRWSNAETGRVTQGAALMGLARAHFARREYAAALPLLDAIVESGEYQLQNTYADVFRVDNNSEIIYAGQFDAGANQGAGFMLSWLPESGTDITDGPARNQGGFNIPTCSLLEAYEEGDLRKVFTIGFYDTPFNNPELDSIPYSRKFLEVPFPTGGVGIDIDFPIMRYADVLLMQAEARLETEGGLPNSVFETLNGLRARAGLPFYFPGNPVPELDLRTEEDLRQAIRRERRVELAYENSRTYDLIRYGTYVETMLAHGEEQKGKQSFLDDFPEAYTNIRILLAIPPNEVELYGYTQNPGWE
ncbi:MAG: RagB/SusD family nutrient uptake outer membrane protein [Bacteroidota bacterium]